MTARHTMAVVFDLDGTLVDTMTSAPQAYADTIRSLGGPEVSPSDVLAVWHIGPTPVVLEHFLGRPVSLRDTERFHRHFADVVASVEAFPGVVEMLDALSRGGHRLGVPHHRHPPSRDEHADGGRSRWILPSRRRRRRGEQAQARPGRARVELPTTRYRRDRRRLCR
jgi:Haloacid dehalogenase-like hydrolase